MYPFSSPHKRPGQNRAMPAARGQDRAKRLAFESLQPRHLLTGMFVEGEILVRFASEQGSENHGEFADASGFQSVEKLRLAHSHSGGTLERIRVPAGVSIDLATRQFRDLPGVVYAEPNWIMSGTAISNDPEYVEGRLWGMYSDDLPVQVGPGDDTTNEFGSQAEEAWYAGFTGSRSVVIGVIDTGIQFNHPDLAANMWLNPFDPVDGVDNDGNGYVDDSRGWDFVNNDSSVYDSDEHFHGTHVAGTIGAVGGNGAGVAGLAWNVSIISGKFLGSSGRGTTFNAIRAVNYLTDLKTRHGVNVVATNNSWGGRGYSQGLHEAITRGAQQGILFVAAAGNDSRNTDTSPFYPASYSTIDASGYEAVISVASLNSSGSLSAFSNFGSTSVDLAAPGESIYSTDKGSGYGYASGTSMAAPHVAGAAALFAAHRPGSTAERIRSAILNTSKPTASLAGITLTGGRLDVSKLMNRREISISNASVVEGNSGTKSLAFQLRLNKAATVPVSVQYSTLDRSAVAGRDYAARSGTVTFAPGQTAQSISVPIIGDTLYEHDERFEVRLENPSRAQLASASATATITNDDRAPSFSLQNVSLMEGSGSLGPAFVVRVNLSAAAGAPIDVDYSTEGASAVSGVDFVAANGSLRFEPGQVERSFVLEVVRDVRPESDEVFYVNGYASLANTTTRAMITLRNDDAARADMAAAVRNGHDWYLDLARNGGVHEKLLGFGLPGDTFVTGDWDGDGYDNLGAVRPNPARGGLDWYLDLDGRGGNAERIVYYGLPGDTPVVGDWNGDGKDDLGVVRTNTARGGLDWYLDLDGRGNLAEKVVYFGLLGDTLVVGDWNADGVDDFGAVRKNRSRGGLDWYLDLDRNGGLAERVVQYGLLGDIPVAGDWDGDGDTDFGAIRSNAISGLYDWYLDLDGLGGLAERTIGYGLIGDRLTAGYFR